MKICIAGYPRSGTNWLQRLVAQSTNGIVPAYKLVAKTSTEPNQSINQQIINPKKEIKIYRTHFLPEQMPDSVTHYVYIYRNVFDVFISAYHYFGISNKVFTTKFPMKQIEEIVKQRLSYDLNFRRKVKNYIDDFCIKSGPPNPELYGRWDENVNAWLSFISHKNLNAIAISYESLNKKTYSTLREVFNTLQIKINDSNLQKSIDAQTFEKYREVISKNDATTSRTMRKGIVGTGEKELPKECKDYLTNHYEQTLIKLGYL